MESASNIARRVVDEVGDEAFSSDNSPWYTPDKRAVESARRAVEVARGEIVAILEMDDDEVGDFNEWGDVQRVMLLRKALGMDS